MINGPLYKALSSGLADLRTVASWLHLSEESLVLCMREKRALDPVYLDYIDLRLKFAVSNSGRRSPRANKSSPAETAMPSLDSKSDMMAAVQALAKTSESPLRVLVSFIDLDDLRVVNNQLGHIAGDRFLTACATSLDKACRSGDLLCRFGGDEFVMIMPITQDLDVDNLKATISKRISSKLDIGDTYTMSCGFADGYISNQTWLTDLIGLIDAADKQMLQNKCKSKESLDA